MKTNDGKKTILLLCILILAVIAVAVAIIQIENRVEGNESHNSSYMGAIDYQRRHETVYINGEPYTPRKGVSSVLVIGVDTLGKAVGSDSYNNSEKADFLALIVFDDKNEKYTVLHINRDTMADVPMLDIAGKEMGKLYTQLAIAHTYGDGLVSSCKNTVKAVSDYLYGVEIDNYISVTMDAVSRLNDCVGGVTVTVDDDMTAVDPSFVKGTTVTLLGDKALAYVRARGAMEDSSNLARMERQKKYLAAFVEKLADMNVTDTFLLNAYDQIAEYSVTNCDTSFISALSRKIGTYSYAGAISPKGDAQVGEKYMEFYADEEDLINILIELFYDRTQEPTEN